MHDPDAGASTLPDWLAAWQHFPLSTGDALDRLDGLHDLKPEIMTGRWRGQSLPTGHPLDGLLEDLGWHGKIIESPTRVHPLVFRLRSGQLATLEPALMPVGAALTWPSLARSAPVRAAFAMFGPMLRARDAAAFLALREFRGQLGTALVYRRQPITDHLRQVNADRVIGVMERKGMLKPFFFLLSREVA